MTDNIDEIGAWLCEREKLYTSVIPGVMDSLELEDMRKLLALVRVYREANLPPYAANCIRCEIARAAELKAKEIVEGK